MDVLGVVVVLLLTHPLEVGVAKGEEVKDITAVAEVVWDTLPVMEVLGVEVVLLLTQALGLRLARSDSVPLGLPDRAPVTDWEAEAEGEPLTLRVALGESVMETEAVGDSDPSTLLVIEVLGVDVVLLLTHTLVVRLVRGEEV
jgi:hypothetical protein